MRRTPLLLLVAAAAALTLPASAGAITLDEYSRGISADPHSIVRGSDGAMWFAETGTGYGDGPNAAIGRIDGNGQVQEFRAGLESTSNPWDLVPGRDGALWFVDGGTRRIGRVTPAGTIREFSTGLRKTQWLQGVAPNRDGSMTFVADGGETIGRMTSSGHVRRWKRALPKGTSRKNASVVSPGPDGRPWVASGRMRGVIEPGTGRVRWRAAGSLADMVRGTGGTMWLRGGALVHVDRHGRTLATYKESRLAEASAMVATPDGHLWLTSGSTEQIIEISGSRITKHGPGLRPDEGPHGLDPSSIGVDADGQLWVTGNQRVARIVRTSSCRVPDVVAMPERDAIAAVAAGGCSAVVRRVDSGGDGPVGVSAQSVERRRALPVGGEVQLTVDHLANACRWPEGATVRAIPGGLVGTYEVEVILNTFEQRKDVCLPDTGRRQRISTQVVEMSDDPYDSFYSSVDAEAVAGPFVLLGQETGDKYGGNHDIVVLDTRSGKSVTVASMDMYEFRGATIRDDGAVAWVRYAFDGPPIIWFRKLDQAAQQVTRLAGAYSDLHLGQNTISWTDDGVPHSAAID